MKLSSIKLMTASIRFFVIIFSMLCQNILAQNVTTFTVRGTLTDSIERQPLDAAHVAIVRAQDSTSVSGVLSDDKGVFEISKVAQGQYILVISYLGYQPKFKPFTLSGTPRSVNLGFIGMERQNVQLGEVVVAAKFNPIIVKKDTIEFNTSAYKIQDSDVVEDLLKKLPGVEVDQDGSVTAGGQQITKVFVDGKQFFGDDPKVALKNLPANAIDKVQVVDRKSDQAQFTGIEDDDTEKVINLTLRPGNRDGTFGRAMAGYGTDKRYDANGLISYFSGETQLAALLSSNNTNNLNFSDFMGDVMNNMGGGGRRSSGSGGSGPSVGGGGGMMIVGGGGGSSGGGRIGSSSSRMGMMAGGGGISTNTAGGFNANYTFGEKLKLGANYSLNAVDRVTDQKSNRVNFVGDSSLNYIQTQLQNRKSQNHRMNLELDYTINENNSLLFRPYANIGSGNTNSDYNYETYTPSNDTINRGKTKSYSENTSLMTSGMLLWRHKFEKVGRTLSTSLNYGVSNNKSNGINDQINWSINPVTGIQTNSLLYQDYTNNNNGYNYNIRASYVEPVGDNRYLEFSYSYRYNKTKSEKETWDVDKSTGERISKDEEYSTLYENTYTNHQADIRFNTRRDKYSYILGAGIEPSSLTSVTGYNGKTLTQNVINFRPTANFTYGETRQNQLRFDYRGFTQQPSIQQLQPVADNTDPLYEFKGNESLKPAFNHSVNFMYNKFNPENLRTVQTSLGFNNTRNSIVNSNFYDESGKQTVVPVNVNGVYNVRAGVNMNLPIAKTKLSFNNDLSGRYGNSVNMTNNVENTTKTSSINEMLRLTFRNDWFELGGLYRLGFNHAVYSMQGKATTDYFNHRVGGNLFINLPLKFIITSNFNYDFYRGYGDDDNRDMMMWTADLSKQIFKNKRGTIKLYIYDILKQNKSYSRTTTDNYVEDLHTRNNLGQFVMLSFMYRFNSLTGGSPSQDNMRNDDARRFEGGGPPPGAGPPPGVYYRRD